MIERVPIGKYCVFTDPEGDPGKYIAAQGINYEPHVRKELERLIPGASGFLDIGANVGVHSISAKDINPDVFVVSVEVSYRNIGLLCQAVAENGLDKFIVIPAGVSGEPRIMVEGENGVDNIVCVPPTTKHRDNALWFAQLPISFYRLPPIDLIKMDVDGYEFNAWLGMTHLFDKHVPMIFELCPQLTNRSGVAAVDQLQWLLVRGYSITVMDYVPGTRRTFTEAQPILDYMKSIGCWVTDLFAERRV